jgi:hypothetical protein
MAKKSGTDKKQTAKEFKIAKRGDGRYEVRKRCGGNINGTDKIKILLEAGLIKTKLPTPKVEAAPEGSAEAPATT